MYIVLHKKYNQQLIANLFTYYAGQQDITVLKLTLLMSYLQLTLEMTY